MIFTKDHLTPGEKLHLLYRRSGLTYEQWGQTYEVTARCVKRWAKDSGSVPYVQLEEIKPWEACYILQRRLGANDSTMAKSLGVSRRTVSAWARGTKDWKKYMAYFEKLGWEFPD